MEILIVGFVVTLLTPIIMIIVGKCFSKTTSLEINEILGYRTSMSMKNQDTWLFANQYMGKLWFKLGWILLLISLASMLLVIGSEKTMIEFVMTIISLGEVVILVLSIIPVELALKKTFDKNGCRIKDE